MILKKQKNSLLIAICLLFLFVGFTWIYEDYTYDKRYERINKAASLLGYSLWHMDKNASSQELKHMVKAENLTHAYLKHSDGSVFIYIANEDLRYTATDLFFSRFGLMNDNPVSLDIGWNDSTIGYLQTSWKNRNFYTYLYISVILASIWIIFVYSLRLRESHQLLEKEVEVRKSAENELKKHRTYLEAMIDDRTLDLQKSNSELISEIAERKRADEEIRQLNQKLEHLVEERTAQYVSANKSLQESLENLKLTQNQLVQSEKMASLGSLVAGVAHEINTPLGVGVTAASFLKDKTQIFSEAVADGAVDQKCLKKYVNTATEASSMISNNLNRAADLINSFKQVAVDRSSEIRRSFNFYKNIDELLTSLKPRFKRTKHVVSVDCPGELVIDNFPGIFSQIFTNLIINSIIHGFEDMDNGKIILKVTTNGNNDLNISYSDNGKGMDGNILPRIYDPFFTTKRNREGGSGLGMHIVYNLVVQTLGGGIECESTPGEGTAFTITIPISPPVKNIEQ